MYMYVHLCTAGISWHVLSHFSLSLYRFFPLLLPIQILSIYVYIFRCMYMSVLQVSLGGVAL